MTNTTIVDPGHAQRQQRRADDKSGPSGNRLNFNPLHPSMELPPEQLIRLLGMESKKIRKSRKVRNALKRAAVTSLTPVKTQPQAARPVDRSIQYERCEAPQVFDDERSRLLVPSLLVGVVAGIVVSGYLFWYEPADTAVQKTPAPAVVKTPQKSQSERQLVKRPLAPAAASATEQKMSAQENAAWRAAVEAQEQNLRSAAEQRMAERVLQLQQASRHAEQPAPEPANDAASPVGMVAAPLETSTEPSSGVPLPKPVSAAATQDAQESPTEAIQYDAGVLPVMPGESAVVLPAAVAVEEIPAYEDAETDEMPVIEPAPAEPVATDIQPEVPPQSEADPVLTPADSHLL